MRSIKSKIISLILCVAFTLTLWPISSFAAIDSFEDLGNAFSGFVDVFTNFTEQLNNASTSDVAVDGASSDVMTTETGDEEGETSSDETQTVCEVCNADPCVCIKLDFVVNGEEPTPVTMEGYPKATIASTDLVIYEYYTYGSYGVNVGDVSGEEIELLNSFTYTNGEVIYRFAYDTTTTNEEYANAAKGYYFISANDITIAGDSEEDELVPTEKTDSDTGVSISAELPADVELEVTTKTLSETGLDTDIYPIGDASLFYDVTLIRGEDSNYQPENGITVTFPEEAILNSGLEVGDSYHIYHIHDGEVEMFPAEVYNGGDISVDLDSLSDVGIVKNTETVDLKTQYGEGTSSSITQTVVYLDDSVTLYDGFGETVSSAILTGYTNTEIEIYTTVTFANDTTFVLHQFAYYGDDSDLKNLFNSYQFISSTDISYTELETEVTLTDDATGITVTGNIPDYVTLVVSIEDSIPGYVDTSFINWHDYIMLAYDISLWNADGTEWQPDSDLGETVTVTIPNAWDPDWGFTRVDVYHDKNSDGEYDETKVEVFSTINEVDKIVSLYSDGSISFETGSFSTFVVNGSGVGVNVSVQGGGFMSGPTTTNTYSHIIYITAGSSATVNFGRSATLEKTEDNSNGMIVSTSTANANQTITASTSAKVGQYATFTYTWTQNDKEYTAEIKVVIIDVNEVSKYEYLTNTVNHLQIDIDSTAVALGYYNNNSFSLDLGFTNGTSYILKKVEDDSAVGFYYVLTYSYTDSNNKEIPVTITVRVDELATVLPEGITFADIGDAWFVTQVISQESQVTFGNKNDSSKAQFPVGTKDNPIIYSITVETTKSLVKDGESEAKDVNLSLSNNICYWDDSNECPGKHTSSIGSQSGMDLGSFSTGTELSDGTVAYVVYSSLTKEVDGYTFGGNNLANRNYVFKISGSLDSGTTWKEIDQISITVDSTNGQIKTTSLNSDAEKYEQYLETLIDDTVSDAIFKIEEISYSISGYTCEVTLSQLGTDGSYTNLVNGEYSFSENYNASSKLRIFSITIKCLNDYEEKVAGISVEKVVKNLNGDIVNGLNDTFKVRIQPTYLDLETKNDDETAEAALSRANSEFNSGLYSYSIDGSTVNSTLSVSTTELNSKGYGYIEINIQAGQTFVVENLPSGTYNVWEVSGDNTAYTYDTENNIVVITDDTKKVEITNIIKNTTLTIVKTGLDYKIHTSPENCDLESAIIKVQKTGSDTAFYVALNKGNNYTATITGLTVGDTYTVTEVDGWTWRYSTVTYTANSLSQSTVNLVADYTVTSADPEILNGDVNNLIKNYVVIANGGHNDKWLGGDNYAVNKFAPYVATQKAE